MNSDPESESISVLVAGHGWDGAGGIFPLPGLWNLPFPFPGEEYEPFLPGDEYGDPLPREEGGLPWDDGADGWEESFSLPFAPCPLAPLAPLACCDVDACCCWT